MSGVTFQDNAPLATDLSASFYTHFQASKNDIASRLKILDASGSNPSPPGPDINILSSDIVKLRKDLVDATPYLPSYDRGKCEQQLKELEESLSRHRAPKSKFAFKRKPASAPAVAPLSSFATSPPAAISVPPALKPSTTNITLSSRTCAYLTLASLEVPPPVDAGPLEPISAAQTVPRSSDVTLTNLTRCIVNLLPPDGDATTLTITALHAHSLHRVVLLLPPIQGSVLLHDIQDSLIVVGCHQDDILLYFSDSPNVSELPFPFLTLRHPPQLTKYTTLQFRIHDSAHTTVLVHVLSNPVIEKSCNIRFGAYPSVLQHTAPAYFALPSRHALVQDFDWIRATPSPHWSVAADNPDEKERMAGVLRIATDGPGSGDAADVADAMEQILPRR